MFDDNQFDLWAKSMLENVQEEVPERVWKHVSARLDKTATKKKAAVLYWRRAVPAIAAVAAVFAAIIFLKHDDTAVPDPYSSNGGLIAIVRSEKGEIDTGHFIADAKEIGYPSRNLRPQPQVILEEQVEKDGSALLPVSDTNKEGSKSTPEISDANRHETDGLKDEFIRFPEDWEEDAEPERKTIRASVILSGSAGSNNPKNNTVTGPLRIPQMSSMRPQTGIRQTSTESTYGIPLSAGVGVKINFTPRWAIGIGLNYTLLTRDFYGSYTLVGDNGDILISQQSDIRNSQHYVGIPLNAYYNIISHEKIKFYTYAGGAVEKCIDNRFHILNSSVIHKEKATGVQLSANIGIGAEFIVGKYLGIYIDPSIRYYFHNHQPQSIRTVQPLMLGFEVGLRVNL